MAINGKFRVSMDDVFPPRAFVVGDVEAGARAMRAPAAGITAPGKPTSADGKAA